MQVTKYGHSCLLLADADARLLLDPGVFSHGFEGLTGLTGVLVTHKHSDHLDLDRLRPLLEANPGAQLLADEGSATMLRAAGVEARSVTEGERTDLGGLPVEVVGRDHAVIHPDVPGISNVGYFIGERFFYPGDAFTDPGRPVELLGLPTAAPWLKVSEAIDYLRRLRPAVAVPMHEAVLARPGTHYGLFQRFGSEQGTEVRILDGGKTVEL